MITVPCTVDGNVCHNMLEASVGFDTSSKIYSQIMGNILIDCASAFKYWYFIRIMGRDPSHLALECALRTYPNMAIISEEVREQGKGIEKIVKEIADLVVQRSEKGKNFGTVLIPEGLLVNMGKIKPLIDELNELMEQLVVYQEQKQTASRRRSVGEKEDYAMKLLTDKEFRKSKMSPWGRALFETFPEFTQKQLLIDPDHTGCIEVSRIESEKLLAYLVDQELKKRKKAGTYKGSFATITHYFGYQGRSGLPTLFDCDLAQNYGYLAGALVSAGVSGYCVTARGLVSDADEWHLGAIPLIAMTQTVPNSSYGINMPIIKSGDVD